MASSCRDDNTRALPIEQCDGNQICVKYLSSFFVECKYGRVPGLAWALYYFIVALILIVDWIALNTKTGECVILPLTVLQIIGISLVLTFDNITLEGTYNNIHFTPSQANGPLLHGVGVLLLICSNFVVHLLIVMEYSGIISVYYVGPEAGLWKLENKIERGLEMMYALVSTLFMLFFILDNIVIATLLEYIIGILFSVLAIMAGLCYDNLLKLRSGE